MQSFCAILSVISGLLHTNVLALSMCSQPGPTTHSERRLAHISLSPMRYGTQHERVHMGDGRYAVASTSGLWCIAHPVCGHWTVMAHPGRQKQGVSVDKM